MVDFREVRRRRRALEMSLHCLAVLADVNVGGLSAFERGLTAFPPGPLARVGSVLSAAEKIAEGSALPVNWRQVGKLRPIVKRMQAIESEERTALVG